MYKKENKNICLNSKINKILEEGKKYQNQKCIIGPTGPTGPSETITIRNTITIPYTEAALVDSIKEDKNHILDFYIPQGKPGPTGPAGTSISILGSYDNINELLAEHPEGETGDGYLVGNNLYVWSETEANWIDVGTIKGPKGEQGEIGPTGPTGPSIIRSAYLVTYNYSTQENGITVQPSARIPIQNEDININHLITLNAKDYTIQFNFVGYYKITIIINAYSNIETNFDQTKNFISFGFKETNTDNIYIGESVWCNNTVAKEIVAQGIITVPDTNSTYELINTAPLPIYLNSPNLKNISSNSYFTTPLVNIIIEYLGK